MTERRAALLKKLCRRRHETIANLAAEFGVSERTIRRDIEEMSLSEPIYTQPGRYGGGVYVTDNFYMDRMYLGDAEIALLQKLLLYATTAKPYLPDEAEIALIEKILADYTKPQPNERSST